MTPIELNALCELLMVSDPWPRCETHEAIVKGWANAEAVRHGYANWVAAYHAHHAWEQPTP